MNNYNIISPFQLIIESDSKKNAIKKLINENYINDKKIDEYSNQVILEDENKNRFNVKTMFYKKYHSRSHYTPKVKITFIPTTASSVYGLPIYKSSVPILLRSPIKIVRRVSPVAYPIIRSPIIRPSLGINYLIPRPISAPRIMPAVINQQFPPPINPLPVPTMNVAPSLSPVLSNNKHLLTRGDISILMTTLEPYHFRQYVEPKLARRKSELKIDNNITGNYNDIYITSDLHADYRKLVQILVNAGLIRIPVGINLNDDGIYDYRIITESEWIKPNSLFVIIGDLVDGNRTMSVNDKYGSFELLLHFLLYNLKIRANENNSDVVFTIGNHDFHSVLLYTELNPLIRYIHPTVINYFRDNMTRTIILSQFYNVSPYLFLNINNNEIVCVHGGLHNPFGLDNLNIDRLIELQNNINRNGISGILNNDMYINNKIPEIATPEDMYSKGALWTRFYAQSTDRNVVCNSIKGSRYNFIVVGHCPTNNFNTLTNIMENDKPNHIRCERNNNDIIENSKGCVIVDTCRDNNNAPVLAFVDTSLSQAFRSSNIYDNQLRNIELLHLSHDNTKPKIGNRKYNVISRMELVNNQQPKEIRVY